MSVKDEIQDALVGIQSISEEALKKIEEYVDGKKAELDKETRRKMRTFWGVACVLVFFIGLSFGSLC